MSVCWTDPVWGRCLRQVPTVPHNCTQIFMLLQLEWAGRLVSTPGPDGSLVTNGPSTSWVLSSMSRGTGGTAPGPSSPGGLFKRGGAFWGRGWLNRGPEGPSGQSLEGLLGLLLSPE